MPTFFSQRWFKLAGIPAVILVVLVLALLLVPTLIDINTYRGQIVSQLEQKLGRKVKLGTLGLRVFPSVNVRVDELAISDDPQVAIGDFVSAKSVRLQIGLWTLLRGNPQVQGVELIEPQVTLIKSSGDKWNWGTLKPLQSPEQGPEPEPFDVRVTNGQFKLIDRTVTPPTEGSYTGVNVALNDFSPRRAFDFVVGLTMPGAQAGTLNIEGQAGPIDAKDAALTPINARMKLNQVELASLESLAGVQSPRAGRLTSDVTIQGKLAEGMNASGTIKAEQLRLMEGVEPARTPLEVAFKLNAKSEKKSPDQSEVTVKLDECTVKLGKTEATLSGQLSRLPAQPTMDLQIKGDKMALESLLESAYAFGFGPPPGTKASGAATINLRAMGEAKSPVLTGNAEVRDLKFQSSSLPQAISISELKLTCDPQAIIAAPFRATLSRTTVEFSNLKLSNYSQAPRAHLEISTGNAQLDDLLKIAESFGARPDATGSGAITLRAAIDTNLSSESRAMTVNGQGKLSNARLQPTQMAKSLEIANADIGFTGDSLRIDNLAAKLGGSDAAGWLTVKDFDRPAITFQLRANQINVPELQGAMAASKGAKSKSSSAMRADGQLNAGKVLLEGITANDVQGKLLMQNQILTLAPLTAKLYNGSYQGAVRVDQSQTPPEIVLDGKFNGLDINQFLSANGSKSLIYGRADGAINVRGRAGDAPDALAKSLLGSGAISISDGKLGGMDLMKQVEILGKLANLPTGGAGTAFRSLKSNLRFERGRMMTDALQIVMEDLSITGEGAMGLGDAPSLDYSILARLSPGLTKRVTPRTSGEATTGGAGGKLGNVLGNAFGSTVGNFFVEKDILVIPLRISGALSQPSFGLDAVMLQRRAKDRLLENAQDRFLKKSDTAQQEPGKEPVTEPGKEPAKDPAKETKPADVLKGVLDKFKRKDKPQP